MELRVLLSLYHLKELVVMVDASVASFNLRSAAIVKRSGKIIDIMRSDITQIFDRLEIKENIFTAGVNGRLLFHEPNNIGDALPLVGGELLFLDIETPEVEDSRKQLRFFVHSLRPATDEVQGAMLGNEKRLTWVVEFGGSENIFSNYTGSAVFEYNEDNGGEESDTDEVVLKIATSTEDGEESDEKGLVNILAEKFFNPSEENTNRLDMEIEPTANYVWLKKNETLYPHRKPVGELPLIKLMNYLVEKSIPETNINAANYLFWQDLDGWHYKSVNKIISDYEERNVRNYIIEQNTPGDLRNAFLNFVPISDFSPLSLFHNAALISEYERVDPNYEDPYLDFISSKSTHQNVGKLVQYSYFEEFDKIKRIEQYPIVSNEFEEYTPSVAVRRYDTMHGYYEDSIYNDPQIRMRNEHTEYSEVYKKDRDTGSRVLWQPMFDHVEYDGSILKKLIQFKKEQKQKKKELEEKRELKEKWSAYRCSVCCLKNYNPDAGYTGDKNTTSGDDDFNVAAAGTLTDAVNYDPEDPRANENGFFSSYQFEEEQGIEADPALQETMKTLYRLRESGQLKTLRYLIDGRIWTIQQHLDGLQSMIDTCTSSGGAPPFETTRAYQKAVDDGNRGFTNYQFANGWTALWPCGGCYYAEPVLDADGRAEQIEETDPETGFVRRYSKERFVPDLGSPNCVVEAYQRSYVALQETLAEYLDYKELLFTDYDEFINRKVYVQSKKPYLEIPEVSTKTFKNIKSITRQKIRGSRYEVLAKKQSLKEDVADSYDYFVNYLGFGEEESEAPHPYYDQKLELFNNNATNSPGTKTYPYLSNSYSYEGRVYDRGNGYVRDVPVSYFNPEGTTGYSYWWYGAGSWRWHNWYGGFGAYLPIYRNLWWYGSYWQNKYNYDYSVRNNAYYSNYWDNYRYRATSGGNIAGGVSWSSYGGYNDEFDSAPIWYETQLTNPPKPEPIYDPDGRPISQPPREPSRFTTELSGFHVLPGVGGVGISNYITGYSQLRGPDGLYNTYDDVGFFGYSYLYYGDSNGNRPVMNPEKLNFGAVYGLGSIAEWFELKQEQGIFTEFVEENYQSARRFLAENQHYIRVEFEEPIGEESLEDFPYGFVRDAGSEYYLPYNVQITAGPFGRQSANYNVSIIGMDPYGFDVAVTRTDAWRGMQNNVSHDNPYLYPAEAVNQEKIDPINVFYKETTFQRDGQMYGLLREETQPVSSLDYFPRTWHHHLPQDPYILRPSSIMTQEHIERLRRAETPSYYLEVGGDLYGSPYQTVDEGETFYSRYLSSSAGYSKDVLTSPYGRLWRDPAIFEEFPEENIWKYDLSGEAEYGVFSAPILPVKNFATGEDSDYVHLLEKNFSAQFIVYGKESTPCRNYECGNTGPVSPPKREPGQTDEEYDPYLNCPMQELRPDYLGLEGNEPEPGEPITAVESAFDPELKEPTRTELDQLEDELKVSQCDFIETELGPEYLGCVYSDPDLPYSCNCPQRGELFKDLLPFYRTKATFWSTPDKTTLLRDAHMVQLTSQTVVASLPGDLTLRPGTIINVVNPRKADAPGNEVFRRTSGKYLVSKIDHRMSLQNHIMSVTLTRDSSPQDSSGGSEPQYEQ